LIKIADQLTNPFIRSLFLRKYALNYRLLLVFYQQVSYEGQPVYFINGQPQQMTQQAFIHQTPVLATGTQWSFSRNSSMMNLSCKATKIGKRINSITAAESQILFDQCIFII